MNGAFSTLAIAAAAAILALIFLLRMGRFWTGWLFSTATGLLALGAVNLTGVWTGVTLPLSLLSLGVAGLGGVPGVVLMLSLRLLWPV